MSIQVKVKKTTCCTPWNPSSRELPVDLTHQKMQKNFCKAVTEHRNAPMTFRQGDQDTYCSLDDPILKGRVSDDPISLNCSEASAQSFRRGMEDAHLILQTKEGTLLTIFDGHSTDGLSGGDLASFVNEYFKDNFFPTLQKNKQNIHLTFEEMIHEVHTQVAHEHELGFNAGCTAALCYVNPQGKAYTATLGDSEFYLYRQGKVIPLSCVRDFGSRHDAKRAIEALGISLSEFLRGSRSSKELRFPLYNALGYRIPGTGINVSRVIGDKHANFYARTRSRDLEPLTHKPKITEFQVEPDDLIVGGCDGVWDYLSQKKILSILEHSKPGDILAEKIMKQSLAIHHARDCDNVSVITAKVIPALSFGSSSDAKPREELVVAQ